MAGRTIAASVQERALAALRAVLRAPNALELDAEQEAEVLAYMTATGLTPDNPIVIAFVDLLRVKADIGASVESAVARGTVVSAASLDALALEIARLRDSIADAPRSDATLTPAVAPVLAVQASAAAAFFVAIASAAVVLAIVATWLIVGALDANRYSADAPHIARYLVTPGGKAAAALLASNGDGLAQELQRCTHFSSGGRDAMTCTLWANGLAPNNIQTPTERAIDVAIHAPAWPLAAFIAAVTGIWILLRALPKKKNAW